MASPQKENGYTPIANEILERLMKTDLKGSHFSMIFAIMRKTYGFRKKADAVGIDQLIEMMGVSRRTVIYTLQDLEAKRILLVSRSRNSEKSNVNIISFNKNYDEWNVGASCPQVKANRSSAKLRKQKVSSAKLSTLAVQNSVKSLHSFAPTKETIQKKPKEISKTVVLQGVQWQELIDCFEPINPLYEELYRNTTERSALEVMTVKFGYQKLLNTIKTLPAIVAQPYAPKITKPTELKRDLGKLLLFIKQKDTTITSKQSAVAHIS